MKNSVVQQIINGESRHIQANLIYVTICASITCITAITLTVNWSCGILQTNRKCVILYCLNSFTLFYGCDRCNRCGIFNYWSCIFDDWSCNYCLRMSDMNLYKNKMKYLNCKEITNST